MQSLILFIFVILTLNLHSESSKKFIIQLDNDFFLNEDEDYTNGLRLASMHEKSSDAEADTLLEATLKNLSGINSDSSLNQYRNRGSGLTRYAGGSGITQLMFTPTDSTALVPPVGERPYAGWLGLEFTLQLKNNQSVSGVTLTLGTTGKASLAEKTQDWVHEHVTAKSHLFKGWDSQVPEEVTINLHFDHKHKLPIDAWTHNFPIKLDGYHEWGAAIGNFQTNAYLGLLVRSGYNLSPSFVTPRLQIGSYAHDLFKAEDQGTNRFSIYTYAGVRGTAVLHDITLNGPVFRSYKYSVDNEPLVGEALVGYGLSWKQFELSHSLTYRTREFKGQIKQHPFGSILLRFSSPF
ncbi:MAG: Uncharacterised protein [Opitutia bacterium UBA7350]|nr:MAG: Uncharacterised protein [Opitutae bacterium UBA7350]